MPPIVWRVTNGSLDFFRDGRFFRRGKDRCPIVGISYGPFERSLGGGAATQRDLDEIARLGFNTLRVYDLPNESFLAACEDRRLSVFISLRWESNTDFITAEDAILDRLEENVRALRNRPAVSGYFIGNEIAADLVRWMGRERVRAFLERAFRRLEAADPARLYAYANYPSTEYLQPRNGDFTAFNVYLEQREALRLYLRRLHHLADDRPLVISEYGLDSMRHGEAGQADALAWLTEDIYEGGAAGAFLFSFTDDWFNGGRQVSDWGFGLVTAERQPKLSAARVSDVLRDLGENRPPRLVEPHPLVSVIVCTYNGHRLLPACLESLERSTYGHLEVLVVDDGSRPGIDAIVARHSQMRYVRQEHAGLGAARNFGARETRGEILAFTDDDCEADPDWVSYLVRELQGQEIDACGGPNIATEAGSLMERCIQMSPGNPTHVMLDDFRAEHLPGCNLAVKREAFEAVGGFRERYRAAGDDVDFCWRLEFAHKRLGFAPNAVVLHRRRESWYRFFCQQLGYGRAEALLQWDHPQKYRGDGETCWEGTVYAPLACRVFTSPVIYFGEDGMAPFQTVYHVHQGGQPAIMGLLKSFLWLQVAVVAFVLGFGLPLGFWVAGLMLLASVGASGYVAWRSCASGRARLWQERILLTWLSWSAMAGRQVARWLGARPGRERWPRWEIRWSLWSSEGVGREAVLGKVRERLKTGVGAAGDTSSNPWPPFDVVLPATLFARPALLTATEVHDDGERLTHFSIKAFLKPGMQGVVVLLGAWVIGQLAAGHWWLAALGGVVLATLIAGIHAHTTRQLRIWREFLEEIAANAGLKPLAP